MKDVWVVSYCDYADTYIMGMFNTKQEAMDYKTLQDCLGEEDGGFMMGPCKYTIKDYENPEYLYGVYITFDEYEFVRIQQHGEEGVATNIDETEYVMKIKYRPDRADMEKEIYEKGRAMRAIYEAM